MGGGEGGEREREKGGKNDFSHGENYFIARQLSTLITKEKKKTKIISTIAKCSLSDSDS